MDVMTDTALVVEDQKESRRSMNARKCSSITSRSNPDPLVQKPNASFASLKPRSFLARF